MQLGMNARTRDTADVQVVVPSEYACPQEEHASGEIHRPRLICAYLLCEPEHERETLFALVHERHVILFHHNHRCTNL